MIPISVAYVSRSMVLSPTPPNETEGASGIIAPFALVDLEKIQNNIYFMADCSVETPVS
jgi:hypothetical protein